ncbi:MAG: pyrroline-5-carboxylate reductase, partial [Halanaerobiaceae bacterium]
MKIGIIGLGKMGTTLLEGMLKKEVFQADGIIASDLNKDIRESVGKFYLVRTSKDNISLMEKADIVILAVKPQIISKVLEEIAPFSSNKLIISIAAGISIAKIKESLGDNCRVIRVMPNTPAMVNEGISAIALEDKYNINKLDEEEQIKKDIEIVDKIFTSVGEVVHVEEKLMDAVTGLSGSGPAYIYLVIEALSDGGVLMGLPRDISMKLAAQTVLGAAKTVIETGKHPGELKDMVTSPAGTTIRAIESLEKNGLRASLISAVKASAEK